MCITNGFHLTYVVMVSLQAERSHFETTRISGRLLMLVSSYTVEDHYYAEQSRGKKAIDEFHPRTKTLVQNIRAAS